jgi:hypothetical protein
MEISLTDTGPFLKGLLSVGLLVGLALLGRLVSPVAMELNRPQVLTTERWLAAAMTRQANAEIERLTADARQMRSLLASEHPDAIQAMALAQRVYTAQRTGTAATATARQALIAAAETLAQYAAGGVERETAIAALNAALERLKALAPQAAAAPAEGSNLRDARLALRTAG